MMIRNHITVDDPYGVLNSKFWDYLYDGEMVEVDILAGNDGTVGINSAESVNINVHIEDMSEMELIIESVKNILWVQWGAEGDSLYIEINVLTP